MRHGRVVEIKTLDQYEDLVQKASSQNKVVRNVLLLQSRESARMFSQKQPLLVGPRRLPGQVVSPQAALKLPCCFHVKASHATLELIHKLLNLVMQVWALQNNGPSLCTPQ